jgi:hypothetical protein
VTRALPARAEVALATASGLLYACTGLLTKALGTTLLPTGSLFLGAGLLAALVLLSAIAAFCLQGAFQRGRATVVVAWTGALSSFLPPALGAPVFGESWPGGTAAYLRAAALLSLAAGFALLIRAAARMDARAC